MKTVKEAAQMLGVSPTRVNVYIRNGRLPFIHKKPYMLDEKDILNFKRYPPHRPIGSKDKRKRKPSSININRYYLNDKYEREEYAEEE